jgi:hypothetical protein
MLAQFNLGEEFLPKYHGRLVVSNILRQLEAVDHPNVGMCLDFGHLYLASNMLGFNYMEAVAEAAPWVRHLHMNDNFGKLDRGENSGHNRWVFGERICTCSGWGQCHTQVFDPLQAFPGYLLEIDTAFLIMPWKGAIQWPTGRAQIIRVAPGGSPESIHNLNPHIILPPVDLESSFSQERE